MLSSQNRLIVYTFRSVTLAFLAHGNPSNRTNLSFAHDSCRDLSASNLGSVAAQSACRPYSRGKDYFVLTYVLGSKGRKLPIFTTPPGVIRFDSSMKPAVTRHDLAKIPGAFMLQDVLTAEECDQIIAASAAMGYTRDGPASMLGQDVRKNQNCVWIADADMANTLFQRSLPHLPKDVDGGAPAGLNARWRLYKYNTSDVFKVHQDSSCPGIGIANGRLVQDMYGDRWSQLTFLVYLNDDFGGGATRFFLGKSRDEVQEVPAKRGAVLCFYHGKNSLSPWHEGALVTQGTKYVIRSDVLYMLPKHRKGVQHSWQQSFQKGEVEAL